MTCLGCGNNLADSAVSCPQCRTLVHGEKLRSLAVQAKKAWRLGHFAEERTLWAESLTLLPEDTVQHRTLEARITDIDRILGDAQPLAHAGWKKASMGIGPALLLMLSKGKLLLLGF